MELTTQNLTPPDREAIADELACDWSAVPTVESLARQGDVMISRAGEVPDAVTYEHTGAHVLARGSHGLHVLVSERAGEMLRIADSTDGVVVLPDGALLVHTDRPGARHGSLRLAPGIWRHWGLRELTADRTVRRVQD